MSIQIDRRFRSHKWDHSHLVSRRPLGSGGPATSTLGNCSRNAAARRCPIAATGVRARHSNDPRPLPNATFVHMMLRDAKWGRRASFLHGTLNLHAEERSRAILFRERVPDSGQRTADSGQRKATRTKGLHYGQDNFRYRRQRICGVGNSFSANRHDHKWFESIGQYIRQGPNSAFRSNRQAIERRSQQRFHHAAHQSEYRATTRPKPRFAKPDRRQSVSVHADYQ